MYAYPYSQRLPLLSEASVLSLERGEVELLTPPSNTSAAAGTHQLALPSAACVVRAAWATAEEG